MFSIFFSRKQKDILFAEAQARMKIAMEVRPELFSSPNFPFNNDKPTFSMIDSIGSCENEGNKLDDLFPPEMCPCCFSLVFNECFILEEETNALFTIDLRLDFNNNNNMMF